MNFKPVDQKDNMQDFVGLTIEKFDIERVNGTPKNIAITAGGKTFKLIIDSYSVQLTRPAVKYVLTGQFKVGNLFAQLTPESFDEESKAKSRLEEIIYEHPSFEGRVTAQEEV